MKELKDLTDGEWDIMGWEFSVGLHDIESMYLDRMKEAFTISDKYVQERFDIVGVGNSEERTAREELSYWSGYRQAVSDSMVGFQGFIELLRDFLKSAPWDHKG